MNCSICSDEIDGKPFVKLKTDGTDPMRLCMFCFTEFERFDKNFFYRICSHENIYVENFWPMNKAVLKIFKSLFHGNANMDKYLETVFADCKLLKQR